MTSPLTAANIDGLAETFGDSGTYTPPPGGGPAVTGIRVEVDHEAEISGTAAGGVVEALDVLAFKRSDYDPPEFDATWSDGTDTWIIGEVLGRNEHYVRVKGRKQ